MSWTNELAREISGRVLTDDASRDAMATDFGRIVVRRPQVVVCPASAEDVARAVEVALSFDETSLREWSERSRRSFEEECRDFSQAIGQLMGEA